MTEAIRTRQTDVPDVVSVYETDEHARWGRRPPTDRIRWGSILGGLFASLTTLVVLGVLGLAVGFTSYDAGDPLSNFGLGAGIWGAVSTLLAFLLGGWLAARTAGVRGRNNGVLNGAMVWVVTIPLVLYLLSSGLGALLNTAGNVAATGAAAAPAAAAVASEAVPNAQATAQDLGAAAQATASALGEQVTPETVENATETASSTAWGTLVALLLGLAAAAVGGLLGARHDTAELQNV